MPTLADFSLAKFQDGVLTIGLAPPTAIGGWDMKFTLQKRLGSASSGLVNKSYVSGLTNGASGITITNSGQGTVNIAIKGADTSGLEFGNYAYTFSRTNSGHQDLLAEGYLLLMPNILG